MVQQVSLLVWGLITMSSVTMNCEAKILDLNCTVYGPITKYCCHLHFWRTFGVFMATKIMINKVKEMSAATHVLGPAQVGTC